MIAVVKKISASLSESILMSVLTSRIGLVAIIMIIGCLDACSTYAVVGAGGKERNIILANFIGPNLFPIMLAARILGVGAIFCTAAITKWWLAKKRSFSAENDKIDGCERTVDNAVAAGLSAMIIFGGAIVANNIFVILAKTGPFIN